MNIVKFTMFISKRRLSQDSKLVEIMWKYRGFDTVSTIAKPRALELALPQGKAKFCIQ